MDSQVSKYQMLGKTLHIISEEICYGRNTIADFENRLYYMGSDQDNIGSAIIAWEVLNDRELNNEELRQILSDNGIMSGAI